MVKSHLSVENYSQQAFYHDEIFSSLHGRNPYFYFCQVRWFASVNQVENSLRVHKFGKILSSRQAPYLSFLERYRSIRIKVGDGVSQVSKTR